MPSIDRHGLQQFLRDYPGMALRPCRHDGLILRGTFSFCASPQNGAEICGSYELELQVPPSFPKGIPKVKEVGGKIPRDPRFHVNNDDTLCLGSPLKILKKIAREPTLSGVAATCIVPFLYAVSNKLLHGGEFVFSELAHGEKGVIDDYLEMLELPDPDKVRYALKLLAMKRRVANKLPCPCNCGKRLGNCRYHFKVNDFRKLASRSWFSFHYRSPGTGM